MSESADRHPDSPNHQRRRLESWKEIAAYLRRTVRTVQRWEAEQGLPIHRLVHNRLPTVYAYADEIDQWWESRRRLIEQIEPVDTEAADTNETPAEQPADTAPAEIGTPRTNWTLVLAGLTVVVAVAAFATVVSRQTSGAPRAEVTTAQDLVTAGRVAWKKRTPGGFREAQTLFEQAIAADGRNAAAYSGLADTYTLLEAFGISSRDESLTKAREAARHAVELAPQSGAAHASLSLAVWEQGDREGGVREMHRAIELDPSYATSRHWYALYLQYLGRYQEAIDEAKRAWALDPSSPVIATDLSLMLRNAGRIDEAEALLHEVVSIHPGFPDVHFQLGEISRKKGHAMAALEHVRQAVSLGDNRPSVLARLAWLENDNGNRGEAVHLARTLLADQARGAQVPSAALVEALAAAGDFDAALTTLRAALDRKEDWVIKVTTDPLFESLRRDRRWPEMQRYLAGFAKQLDLAPVAAPIPR